MKVISPKQRALSLMACISLLMLCLADRAFAESWQNEVTIYGWYSGIDGSVMAPGGAESDFTVDASDILDNLNMIFMGGYEGRYGKWSLIADAVYMDVGNTANTAVSSGTASVNLDIQSWILQGGVGYELVQNSHANLSVVGGVRYLSLDTAVNTAFQGTSVGMRSGSDSLIDGVIGIRGQVTLTDNWYLPYYADIGAGGSNLSYQVFAGIGYRLSWGDIKLGYRSLKFDLDDDKVMQDLQLSGPLLGIGFRF